MRLAWLAIGISAVAIAQGCSSESTNAPSSGGSAGAADGGGAGGSSASGGSAGSGGADVGPSCADSTQNGNESDVDCGGSCAACGAGKNCAAPGDCESQVCTAGTCVAAACDDGVKNGSETTTDCGGGCPCDVGSPCAAGGDCKSKVCTNLLCAPPNCTDLQTNGQETDVDCGGPACPACADLKACNAAADCTSKVCTSSVCQAPTCTDVATNGDETDVDCGGTCPACADAKACKVKQDCVSLICDSLKCVPASCADAELNGDETDLNCGGLVCTSCDDLKKCKLPADCKSGVCTSGVCQVPTCSDQVKNASETDVDCGNGCPACKDGGGCLIAGDCESGVCSGNPLKCQVPSCTDTVKNGLESDVDCGGGSCPACANGNTCGGSADCASTNCNSGKCAVFQLQLTDTGTLSASMLAEGPNGSLFVSGSHTGNVNFTGTPHSAAGGLGGYLLKLDASYKPLWATYWDATSHDWVQQVAHVPSGEIVIAGYTSGGLTLDACATNAPNSDPFVAKLDKDGKCLWAKSFAATGADYVFGLALDGSNNILIAGALSSASDFGMGTIGGAGSADIFVAKFALADGKTLWSKSFGGSQADGASRLAVDTSGNAYVTGYFRGTVDFGGTQLTQTPSGVSDIFVTRLASADGSVTWAKNWGCGNAAAEPVGPEAGTGIALDSVGDVLITGQIMGGGCSLGAAVPPGTGGYSDVFLAKYKSSDGSHVWSKVFPAVTRDAGGSLTLDAQGNPVITGSFSGGAGQAIDFGGGPLPFAGGWDAFVAKFKGSDGSHLFSTTAGGTLNDWGAYALTRPNASLVFIGSFATTVDFGGGAMTAAGAQDGFLVNFGPVP